MPKRKQPARRPKVDPPHDDSCADPDCTLTHEVPSPSHRAKLDAVDDTFDEIAEGAIQRAEKLPCSLPEFYRGLRQMINRLEERYHVGVEMKEIGDGEE